VASYFTTPGSRKAKPPPKGLWDTRHSALTPAVGWLSLFCLLMVLLVTVMNVQTAHWVRPEPRLWLVTILGMFIALLVARAPWGKKGQLLFFPLGLGAGFGLALFETAGTLTEGGITAKFSEMFSRFDTWLSQIGSQGISNDRLPFVFGLVAGAFLMAYLASWALFRLRWSWVAVVVPAAVLLTNQTYLPPSGYPVPLFFFLVFSVGLLARVYYVSRTEQWQSQGLTTRTGRFAFAGNVLLLSTAVFLVGWSIPTKKVVIAPLHDTYQAAREPWAGMEDDFERVFAGVASKKATPLHSFGPALALRGRVSPGTGPVFSVTTDYPTYWKGQTYDQYQGQGWVANSSLRQSVKEADVPAANPDQPAFRKREVIAQRIQFHVPSEVLFAGGTPEDVSIPSVLEVSVPRTFQIDLSGGSNAGLPADLARAATRIVQQRPSIAEMERLLPSETKIVQERRGAVVVTRTGSATPDILSIRSTGRLKADSTYDVISSVSVATETELRAAGSNYPKWVADNYLALPDSLPKRVRDLAIETTRSAFNAYDKALALSDMLRAGYTETYAIEPPPVNVDAVDYFLFAQKAGYSDYFASAMTVMLRAAGIPARLATGYSSGIADKTTGSFTVRLSGAHSWPEVYFPTYGWLPFEPSPSFEPIERGPIRTEFDDSLFSGAGESFPEFFDEFQNLDFPPPADVVLPVQDEPVGQLFADIFKKIGLAIGALLALALGIFALVFVTWQSRFVGLPYAHGIYDRMSRLGTLVWKAPEREETPGEYAAALAAAIGVDRKQAGTVAAGYVKARYTGRPVTEQERRVIEDAWRALRGDLIKRALWRFDPRRLLRMSR